jgi:hypothetical protein
MSTFWIMLAVFAAGFAAGFGQTRTVIPDKISAQWSSLVGESMRSDIGCRFATLRAMPMEHASSH